MPPDALAVAVPPRADAVAMPPVAVALPSDAVALPSDAVADLREEAGEEDEEAESGQGAVDQRLAPVPVDLIPREVAHVSMCQLATRDRDERALEVEHVVRVG